MGSPISNAQGDHLIANARARARMERPPRINVIGAPRFPAVRQVPSQPSAMRIRSNQYNLSATKMKYINVRIGSLNQIVLEVYGIVEDLPMMLVKNMYFEPGNPPKMRRLPNSEIGFKVAFSRMLRGAKKESTRLARLGLVSVPRSVAQAQDQAQFSAEFLMYIATHTTWRVPYQQAVQTPSLTLGITYDILVNGLRSNTDGTVDIVFTRKGRVTIERPRGLEEAIDFRFTPADILKGKEISKAINAMIVNDDGYKETFETIFSQYDTNISLSEVISVFSSGSGSGSEILDITPIASKGRPKKGEIEDKELAAEHNETRK
ncbi:hypothetical protein T492DRAFT_834608 [Pavlovales sp. CCMP2436]|nr:hypothetical protein T492DRAFT_834608 [Pavlovales sp. CCMP2436]